MNKLTKKDANALRSTLAKRDVAFFLMPSPKLCQMIMKNEHPYIKSLPAAYKAMFLEDMTTEKQSAPVIQTEMVIQYMEGTLDAANTFLLDLGEIRTIDNTFKVDINRGE
jgi:hypothetical protein